MVSVTDFHSHVLPGIDDGSGSVEESIAMLRLEAEQGIRRVIATPHFYAQYETPEEFLRKRNRAEARLRKAIEGCEGLPKLGVGAEVYFFRGMSQSDFLPWLTIRGKRCILIEMPPAPWTEDVYRELAAIRERQGLIPIIAHIDRYIAPLRTYGIPRKLAELPVLVQANAGFFLEKSTAGMAIRMLKADQIHLLGSDCHNMTSRTPNLQAAMDCIREKLGDAPLRRIRRYERQILGDQGDPRHVRME
ncbi:MAG: capsular polysaccharide biosynthesis protein [Oscillospiraceae bacterium]|nr:capsular polysaccharide biosynthesis protein [Oscillospiraceae bacterium]